MASHVTDFVSLPLLSVSETAKYLGVGRKIVYQLLEFGEIRAVKRKGAVLIEKASIDSFRSSGKLTRPNPRLSGSFQINPRGRFALPALSNQIDNKRNGT